MVEKQIRLNATEEVKEFVNEAAKCDFDIDISYNRIVIDAKSLLGILSMDLTRELTVRCYGESKRFNKVIEKFAVA
nr:HPr family phosphocarrier protein [uncultured Blautia sp.]